MTEPKTEAALDDLVRIARNGAGDGASNLIQARRAVRAAFEAEAHVLDVERLTEALRSLDRIYADDLAADIATEYARVGS